LPHKDVEILSENNDLLKEMGFEIENFGGNTFMVISVPSYIVKEDLQKVISGLIDDLDDNAKKGDYQRRKERALTYMACRSAVKFGDKLSTEEQKSLVKKLMTLAQPYTCPHGRPTMINMSFAELNKRFGRI
jgi:DNA mismatch repair protein MutL